MSEGVKDLTSALHNLPIHLSERARLRSTGLGSYAKRRNQIEIDGVSRMSAYLHYGMVSPLRIAREASADGAEKFLDELLIWREPAVIGAGGRALRAP